MAQAKTAARKPRRKEKKNIALGHAHIKSTFNNTIVSITDPSGAVISWASSGPTATSRTACTCAPTTAGDCAPARRPWRCARARIA